MVSKAVNLLASSRRTESTFPHSQRVASATRQKTARSQIVRAFLVAAALAQPGLGCTSQGGGAAGSGGATGGRTPAGPGGGSTAATGVGGTASTVGSTGGNAPSGGAGSSGGAATGGAIGSAGRSGSGGSTGAGGSLGAAGATVMGGSTSSGGTTSAGGSTGKGGSLATGGVSGTGGATATAGTTGSGGNRDAGAGTGGLADAGRGGALGTGGSNGGSITVPCSSGNACIDFSSLQQEIDGLGACSAGHGVLNAAVLDAAFKNDTLKQPGLSILRVEINVGGQSAWSDEKTNASNAKARGAKYVMATPWSPPASMKTNSNTVGGELSTTSYAAYAA
jgi:hypothetical protein